MSKVEERRTMGSTSGLHLHAPHVGEGSGRRRKSMLTSHFQPAENSDAPPHSHNTGEADPERIWLQIASRGEHKAAAASIPEAHIHARNSPPIKEGVTVSSLRRELRLRNMSGQGYTCDQNNLDLDPLRPSLQKVRRLLDCRVDLQCGHALWSLSSFLIALHFREFLSLPMASNSSKMSSSHHI